jgi:hypothetical protein
LKPSSLSLFWSLVSFMPGEKEHWNGRKQIS